MHDQVASRLTEPPPLSIQTPGIIQCRFLYRNIWPRQQWIKYGV